MAVSDRTVEFEVTSQLSRSCAGTAAPPSRDAIERNVHWKQAYDGHLAESRAELNRVKSLFDVMDVKSYYAARDAIFPLAQSGPQGSTTFRNRAGFKLNESMQAAGVWEHVTKACKSIGCKRIAFADVCGGPGAFSQALYTTLPKYFTGLKGYGMTLLNEGDDTLQWYPSLSKNKNFTVTYGIEGTGNIYATENIHALASLTNQSCAAGCPLMLVVADGGFDVAFDIANFQEAISARIVYSQWLAAVAVLQPGGCFVLKLFDTFAPFTRSLLCLSTLFFQRVHVVKPKHSRVVNSERYLVCIGFRGAVPAEWMEYLYWVHAEGFTDDTAPRSLLPMAVLEADETFQGCIATLNGSIAKTQQTALEMVLASPLLSAAMNSNEAAVVDQAGATSAPVVPS